MRAWACVCMLFAASARPAWGEEIDTASPLAAEQTVVDPKSGGGDSGVKKSESPSGSLIQGQEGAPKPGAGKKPSRRKEAARKDIEGSEAPDRFQLETVIHSPYRLDGQTLEVDPD